MEKLTKWREQRMTKGELAQALGCNRSQIGRWESGASRELSFGMIEKIDRLTEGEITIEDWYKSWQNRSE
jgi:transcriptional regulator with XRE-family HTH domain